MGLEVSHTLISNVTEAMEQERKLWQKSQPGCNLSHHLHGYNPHPLHEQQQRLILATR
jgi:hypothetical protein